MVRKKRNSSRNRNGGYDLSAAEQATPRRGRSRSDTSGSIRRVHRGRSNSQDSEPYPEPYQGRHYDHDYDYDYDGLDAGDARLDDSLEAPSDINGDRPSRKQAMREAAALAASHLAASGAHEPLAGSSREGAADTTPPASSDTAQTHTLSTGEQERISVGFTDPESTGRYRMDDHDASSYSSDRYKARKRQTSGRRRGLTAVVVVLVVALIGVGAAFGLWYTGIVDQLRGNSQITASLGSDNGDSYYVLLLGGDSRTDDPTDDYGNRTDSIMVARVDEQNQNVSILSIPRDTRVNVEGHGMQKINSVIEFSGYDGVVTEVNELLGIQINYYAFIYFDGFEELVDKLGGVTVAVPEGTYYNGVSVPAGDAVTINGEEALVLARCRHGRPADQGAYAMGDYQRALNQRNLIKAIAKKVLEQDVTKLPDLISSLSECLETDMDVSKIVSLAQNMKGMNVNKIKADTLPYAGASIDGEWYAILFEDVFEDVKVNFKAGKKPYQGLAKYNVESNGDDIGSNYTDGSLYAYTQYESIYGSYKGKGTPKQLSTS